MAINTIKKLARLLSNVFEAAVDNIHVLPIFQEAAEGGEKGGGAKYHGWVPIGIPGAKFHAMTGQSENTQAVRRARAEGKSFRNEVVLDRADYYDSFDGFNSLKM